MGLLILGVFAGAFVCFVLTICLLIANHKKELTLANFTMGLLLALCFYGLILESFVLQEKVYALTPFFRFPLYMCIVPFVLGLLISISKRPITQCITVILFISVVFSGIFMVVFGGYFFEILDKMGIEKVY